VVSGLRFEAEGEAGEEEEEEALREAGRVERGGEKQSCCFKEWFSLVSD
jgi:hypothetical protein